MDSRNTTRNVIFWVLMATFALLIWQLVRSNTGSPIRQLTFSQFQDELDKDNLREVTLFEGQTWGMFDVSGTLRKNNEAFATTIPDQYPDLYRLLREKKAEVAFHAEARQAWLGWAANLLPTLPLLALWVYFIQQFKKIRWQKWPLPTAEGQSPQGP